VKRWPIVLSWGLILIGCALRLKWYFFDRPLWWSEAVVAVTVLNRTAIELFRPLDYHSASPVGFLLAAKLLTVMFGRGELVLRAVPLAAGLVSLPLMYFAARKWNTPCAVPLSMLWFACSPWLIYWSSEAKPYMLDVMFTLLALLAAARLRERGFGGPQLGGAAVGGVVALFSSLAMIFVLPAVLLGISVDDRNGSGRKARIVLALAWIAAGAGVYVVSLHAIAGDDALRALYRDRYLSFQEGRRSLGLLAYAFAVPGGYPLHSGLLTVPLFAIGCVSLASRHRARAVLLIAPIAIAAAASLLGLYPFWNRLILFIAPLLIIAVAEGLISVARLAAAWSRPLAIALAAVLAVQLSRGAIENLRKGPVSIEDIRPLLAHLSSAAGAGDVIYVGELEPNYEYYSVQAGLGGRPYIRGRYYDNDWTRADDATLDELKGQRRVWALTTDEQVPRRLDRLGRRLESVAAADATLYLYDLSTPPSTPR
jgi:hypothetical protein